jgi:hypothetical protein
LWLWRPWVRVPSPTPHKRARSLIVTIKLRAPHIGLSPSGKATDFDSVTRGFESRQPSHESPQSMIQPAEDFSILPMKKPCIQGDCGTPGVRIISGVPLFSFCGGGAPSGKIWNLNPLLAPQERKLRGIGKIKTWHLELPWERWPASYT